ncbi:hypothetical protein [Adlercreutzia sp. ZJ138]|uniref:hypothetical protein n=1 Tax=Adlercreutzia sp. ZJ138 TaxID=2709405 RepID=UPI0013ED5A2C|nr:hypothetical protein [Adlercreutzia sp. ZJ138]
MNKAAAFRTVSFISISSTTLVNDFSALHAIRHEEGRAEGSIRFTSSKQAVPHMAGTNGIMKADNANEARTLPKIFNEQQAAKQPSPAAEENI